MGCIVMACTLFKYFWYLDFCMAPEAILADHSKRSEGVVEVVKGNSRPLPRSRYSAMV